MSHQNRLDGCASLRPAQPQAVCPRPLVHQNAEDEARRRLEIRLRAQGYDLDELERDNPYNAWMREQ